LKSDFFRLSEITLIELEVMALTMLFKHAVEWTECKPRSMITSSPDNIILRSKIRRKRLSFSRFLFKYIMNNLKSSFVRANIIKCEDRIDLIPPFLITFRQLRPFQSFGYPICNNLLICSRKRIIFRMGKCMQFICSNIVENAEIFKDRIHIL
jgi:hypothetical protein